MLGSFARLHLGATLLTSAAALAACGDDLPDPGAGPDAGAPDAPAPDAPASYVAPTPARLPLAAGGPDQLMAAVAGPGTTFYAAGYRATTLAGDKIVVVVKLTSAGALDTTWGGGDGIVDTPLVHKGGAGEIELGVQSTGAIVVAATVAAANANAADAADTDLAVVRLEPDGELDTTFGTGGALTFSLNQSVLDTAPEPDVVKGRDGLRGLAIGPADQIFLHAYQRGEGNIAPQGAGGPTPRVDTEFAVVRVTASGAVDTAYGTGGSGKFLLDIYAQGLHSDATPHGLHVDADGTVIANGYARSAATGNTVQPVLYKVTAGGTALASGFASSGLFHEEVLAVQTEIYAVAFHGGAIVTAGYGRAAGDSAAQNDYLSMRFDAATGARDATFGGATQGAVLVDPAGTLLQDNCRGAVGLASGSTILFGSTGGAGVRDVSIVVLTGAGQLDAAYGDGTHVLDLGGAEDQLWGGARNGDRVLLVGWRGVATQAADANDDSAVVVFDAE